MSATSIRTTSIHTILPLAVLAATAQMGRASALMVLLLLGAGAALTQATALFLMRWQLGAVAAAMAVSAWLSFALVARYPAREHGPG